MHRPAGVGTVPSFPMGLECRKITGVAVGITDQKGEWQRGAILQVELQLHEGLTRQIEEGQSVADAKETERRLDRLAAIIEALEGVLVVGLFDEWIQLQCLGLSLPIRTEGADHPFYFAAQFLALIPGRREVILDVDVRVEIAVGAL